MTRGYKYASSIFITVRATRDVFIRDWKEAFESGKMCIMSWYTESAPHFSNGNIVLGASTMDELQATMTQLRKLTEKTVLEIAAETLPRV